MSGDALLVLLVFWLLSGTLFTYIVYRLIYYRACQRENLYFLFAVRDRMIRLVVEGKLQEDEFLFREFYPFMNHMIRNVNSLRFKHILQALDHERRVVSRKFRADFEREIAVETPEVVEVFADLFNIIPAIIYRNSLAFRIAYSIADVLGWVRKLLLASKGNGNDSISRMGAAYKYHVAYAEMAPRR